METLDRVNFDCENVSQVQQLTEEKRIQAIQILLGTGVSIDRFWASISEMYFVIAVMLSSMETSYNTVQFAADSEDELKGMSLQC